MLCVFSQLKYRGDRYVENFPELIQLYRKNPEYVHSELSEQFSPMDVKKVSC